MLEKERTWREEVCFLIKNKGVKKTIFKRWAMIFRMVNNLNSYNKNHKQTEHSGSTKLRNSANS